MSTEPILSLGYLKEPNGIKGGITFKTQGKLIFEYRQGDGLYLYKCQKIRDGFLKDSDYFDLVYLEHIKKKSSKYLIKFKGIDLREEADKYCGSFVGITLSKANERFGGSKKPYLFEYLSRDVLDLKSHEKIGVVSRIEEYEKNQLLIIKTLDQRELMAPIESPYVHEVDQKRNVLWTKNLFDLGKN